MRRRGGAEGDFACTLHNRHSNGQAAFAHTCETRRPVSKRTRKPHVRVPEFEIRRRHSVMPLERTVEVPASPPSVSLRAPMGRLAATGATAWKARAAVAHATSPKWLRGPSGFLP